jgi:hypothetical protein
VNFVGNGLSLSRVRHRTDHEKIRKRRDFTKIEHAQIMSFFGVGRLRSGRPVARLFL